LADKDTDSVKPLRQLLPFSKVQVDIIVTTATSMIIDSKGNRVQSFEFVDKKPGLQVWEKQRVSPWEIIEGQRNPAQLSWGWFGAVKMERKPLRYEEAHRMLRFHTHNLIKPNAHFLEAVPLPPEDVDMKPEIIMVKEEILMKPDQSPMSDQSPLVLSAPGGRNSKPKPPRKRRQTKAQQQAAAAAIQQLPPPPISSPNQPPPPMPMPPVIVHFRILYCIKSF
jgi:mediator of RNA polymerase II transcription subunit 12